MTNFKNSLNKSLLNIINNDYSNLFYSIVHKYGHLNNDLTIENLTEKYEINYSYLYKINDTKIKRNITIQHKIANEEQRCCARIWANGKISRYQGKVIYGDRCKRTREDNADFCGIHSKSLTHGRFDLEPPHDHFKKFIKN